MRFILFLFLFSFYLLQAKEDDTCYTVQLFSAPLSQKENIDKRLKHYPKECILMQISNTLTMRCGCYEEFKTAEKALIPYKERYHHAVVSVSYKYRFENKTTTKKLLKTKNRTTTSTSRKKLTKKTAQKAKKERTNELHLLFQTFLYTEDLDHAIETAKLALKENPSSIYWNEKMAEVLKWSGRGTEAFKYMEFLYYRTKKSSLAKEIVDYALASYQYEKVKKLVTEVFLNEPNEINKQRMLFIYNQIGQPQESAQLLDKVYQKTQDPQLLTDQLQIYMNLGDLQNAKKVIDIITARKLYTPRNIELISYYYYVNRNIEEAYNVVSKFDFKKSYNKRLNELYSDLGWYLQKYQTASEASLRLIKHKDDRLVDYERVIYTNRNTNPILALNMSLLAYKKFQLDYLFYDFANQTLQKNKTALLEKTIKEIDASNSPLKQEANYWIVKAELYKQTNNKEEALKALDEALKLAPDNISITLQAIDIYQEFAINKKTRYLLNRLTKNPQLPNSYLLAIASFYFSIHDVNQAAFYLDKLKREKDPLVETSEFKFLQDDIYQSQFNYNAHIKTLKELRAILDKKLQEDPSLKHDKKFLYDQLRVDIHLDQVDHFREKLQKAKPFLSQKYYNDLLYSYAAKIDSPDAEHLAYLHAKKPPIWFRFADALQEQDHRREENLLFSFLQEIPRDDAAYGAYLDGQIALAQTLTFQSLNDNEKNTNAYNSMLEYTKERSSLLEAKASYYNRDPLLRKYITLNNSSYIRDGFSFIAHLNYYKNSTLDNNVLIYVPDTTTELYGGIKKRFNRGDIEIDLGKTYAMRDYYTANLIVNYILSKTITFEIQAKKNSDADESIQTLIGGRKDIVKLSCSYNFLNSTWLDLSFHQDKYTSQDGVYIGKGSSGQIILSHQIRNGYPDMRIEGFGEYGKYNEEAGDKGVIEELRKEDYKVLPTNFYNLGLTFNYGIKNRTIYTRVWRPYFEISSYFNSELNGLSYGFQAGYAGSIFFQDHLLFGVDYTNDVNGIGGSILELFLQYQFLYAH